MVKPRRMMSNSRAKEIFADKDLGECCCNCQFYDESRGTDLAVCKKHKILTNIAAWCREYDGKGDIYEA